jgi:hypothetical protein
MCSRTSVLSPTDRTVSFRRLSPESIHPRASGARVWLDAGDRPRHDNERSVGDNTPAFWSAARPCGSDNGTPAAAGAAALCIPALARRQPASLYAAPVASTCREDGPAGARLQECPSRRPGWPYAAIVGLRVPGGHSRYPRLLREIWPPARHSSCCTKGRLLALPAQRLRNSERHVRRGLARVVGAAEAGSAGQGWRG